MYLNPQPRQNNFQNKSTTQDFPYFGDGGKSRSLISYSYTKVMLILILIDVQYLQNVVFLGQNGRSHSADTHHPIKTSP